MLNNSDKWELLKERIVIKLKSCTTWLHGVMLATTYFIFNAVSTRRFL